jgi:hypothetical protein
LEKTYAGLPVTNSAIKGAIYRSGDNHRRNRRAASQ